MRRPVTLVVALAVSLLAGGCSQALGSLGAPAASPAPPTTTSSPDVTGTSSPDATATSAAVGGTCRQIFNAVRCQTMTDYVATQLGTTREQIVRLEVIPEPRPDLHI